MLLNSCKSPKQEEIVWNLESLENIGGYNTYIIGNPEIISTDSGKAIQFDGVKSGLLVNNNPVHNMEKFTIEVAFKPNSGYPENIEQRFLHIQDPLNEDRRILIELRLNDREEWYGDWFIKSENESLILIDSTLTHPVNEWATISLEYENGKVRGYVNGELQASGNIKFLPIGENGKTSIGTRMDERSWFKGAIKKVRFSSEVKNSSKN